MQTQDELSFQGIVGILQVFDDLFLCLVTQSEPVGRCPQGNLIHSVKAVEFIPLADDFKSRLKELKETLKYLEGMRKILSQQGFYFSYYSDLTRS